MTTQRKPMPTRDPQDRARRIEHLLDEAQRLILQLDQEDGDADPARSRRMRSFSANVAGMSDGALLNSGQFIAPA